MNGITGPGGFNAATLLVRNVPMGAVLEMEPRITGIPLTDTASAAKPTPSPFSTSIKTTATPVDGRREHLPERSMQRTAVRTTHWM